MVKTRLKAAPIFSPASRSVRCSDLWNSFSINDRSPHKKAQQLAVFMTDAIRSGKLKPAEGLPAIADLVAILRQRSVFVGGNVVWAAYQILSEQHLIQRHYGYYVRGVQPIEIPTLYHFLHDHARRLSQRPLVAQFAAIMRKDITAGRLAEGVELLPIRVVAAHLGIGRSSELWGVYTRLITDGMVVRSGGETRAARFHVARRPHWERCLQHKVRGLRRELRGWGYSDAMVQAAVARAPFETHSFPFPPGKSGRPGRQLGDWEIERGVIKRALAGDRHGAAETAIFTHLRRLIVSQRILPGEILPTSAAFARYLDLHKPTVVNAYSHLEHHGLIAKVGQARFQQAVIAPRADQARSATIFISQWIAGLCSEGYDPAVLSDMLEACGKIR